MSKCLSCSKPLTYINLKGLPIKPLGGGEWNGVVYCCPYCGVVLGVQIDPIAIKKDVVAELLAEMKRLLQH